MTDISRLDLLKRRHVRKNNHKNISSLEHSLSNYLIEYDAQDDILLNINSKTSFNYLENEEIKNINRLVSYLESLTFIKNKECMYISSHDPNYSSMYKIKFGDFKVLIKRNPFIFDDDGFMMISTDLKNKVICHYFADEDQWEVGIKRLQ